MLVLALYGLYTQQWVLAVMGVVGSILSGIFISKTLDRKNESEINQALSQLLEKEKKLIQLVDALNNSNIPAIQEKLTQDNRVKEQLQLLKIKLEQQQLQYEKIIGKFKNLEIEEEENKEIILKLSSQLSIPAYIANSFFFEAFQLIEQFKLVGRDKKHVLARIENIKLEQANITEKLSTYSKKYLSRSRV